MSFLSHIRFGRGRETKRLEQHVTALQAALNRCVHAASQRAHIGRELAAVLATATFMLGFALGVYREPIMEFAVNVAQTIGLAKKAPSAVDPETAYQNADYATALRLARPPAEAGDARAQSVLGRLYHGGYGVAQDYNEAAAWLRRAADQGDPKAQLNLGVMYSEGQGVPQDYVQAAEWYRRAANQGEPHAQYNLGIFYATGEAGEIDRVRAYMWLSLASAQFPVSDARRRTAVTSRDLVVKLMTREQIAEAQRRARDWKPKEP
jgi:TPR repeat protein